MRVSANISNGHKAIVSGRLSLFWLLTYIATQAAMVFAYRYRHALHSGAFQQGVMILAGMAVVWLALLVPAAPPTWRLLRATAKAASAQLGKKRLFGVIVLIVLGWVRIPSADWFKPGLTAMVLHLAGNASGLVLLGVLVGETSTWKGLLDAARRLGRRFMAMPTWQFLAITSFSCFLLATVLCQFVLRPIAHIQDEAAYLYQATIFAGGRLVNDLAPSGAPDIFRASYIWSDPHSYAVFPPGWPAVLSLGVIGGIAWFVNPVLAGGCAGFLYLTVREVWGRLRARYAVLLLCVCPFFLFLSGSLMSHTLSLLTGLMATSGFLLGRRSWGWSCVGGAGLAMLFLTRPLEGTTVGVVLGIALVWRLVRRGGVLKLTPLFVLALVGPVAWLAYNNAVGRRWFDVPVNRYFREVNGVSNQLGFGPDRGMTLFHNLGPGHSPAEAGFNLQYNLHSGNEKLWGWPGGAAVVIALGLLAGRGKRVPRGFLAGATSVLGAYGLYWYHGECYGPRFYLILLPVMIMLTLTGLTVLAKVLGAPGAAVVLAAAPFTFLVHVPVYGVTFYHNTRYVSESLRAEVRHPPAKPAIVLVRNEGPRPCFSSTMTLNDLALRNEVLYALDRDNETDVSRLHRVFPDRFIYRYRGGEWKLLVPPQDAAGDPDSSAGRIAGLSELRNRSRSGR